MEVRERGRSLTSTFALLCAAAVLEPILASEKAEDYLAMHVNPTLLHALSALCKHKPADPVVRPLSHWKYKLSKANIVDASVDEVFSTYLVLRWAHLFVCLSVCLSVGISDFITFSVHVSHSGDL